MALEQEMRMARNLGIHTQLNSTNMQIKGD